MDLFDSLNENQDLLFRPLADRMRPESLDDLVGQEHVTGDTSVLRRAILNDNIFSMILWGPPGCGKTSLAGIIANETKSHFVQISAVLSGVKDIREIIKGAKERKRLYRKRTILFVDEIHRFNKSQQDAFLFHVEKGIIVLVGATTENPSFEVIPALISRCRIITLNRLLDDHIKIILKKAVLDKKKGLGTMHLSFKENALDCIASLSDGDVRIALTNLETIAFYVSVKNKNIDSQKGKTQKKAVYDIGIKDVENAVQKKAIMYDKSGEEHFNLISVFHKSLRGSDPDAAVYWLARMLKSGEDPFYIIRRMVRFATEDIGIADPYALGIALNAMESFRFLGSPEGDDALFQAAVYLATAPKSNSVYMAHKKVMEKIDQTGYLPVPLHVRNAPTKLMKDLGYNKGYKYAHDYKHGYVPQEYLPDEIKKERFYFPTNRGYENTVKQRLEAWIALKRESIL